MHKRLKTQDRLKVWDRVQKVNSLRCLLCNGQLETQPYFLRMSLFKTSLDAAVILLEVRKGESVWEDFIGFLEI